MNLNNLLSVTKGYNRTCSLENPKHKAVAYALNERWLMLLRDFNGKVLVFIPENLHRPSDLKSNISLLPLPEVIGNFVLFHNEINKDRQRPKDMIPDSCLIHPSAIIGEAGLKYVPTQAGIKKMKHMGNIVLGENVEVLHFSSVQRAKFDSTIVGNNVKIGNNCAIAHNTNIGDETIITGGVNICGSTKIGKNCVLQTGCIIRDNITICDNVRIGMGSVVTKSITEPGTYVGVPAKYFGAWDGAW